MEEEQDGRGLKLQLLLPVSTGMSMQYDTVGVQCAEQESSLSILVSLAPAASQQVVFWLEVVAETTAKPRLQSGEEDGNRIVARSLCELCVGLVVEFEGARCRELLSVVLLEEVAGWFLRSQCSQRQQRRRDQGEELHCGWRWWYAMVDQVKSFRQPDWSSSWHVLGLMMRLSYGASLGRPG
mgnify:CR=1 FL=1